MPTFIILGAVLLAVLLGVVMVYCAVKKMRAADAEKKGTQRAVNRRPSKQSMRNNRKGAGGATEMRSTHQHQHHGGGGGGGSMAAPHAGASMQNNAGYWGGSVAR